MGWDGTDCVRWIPAHSTVAEVVAHGRNPEDHAGNDFADATARRMTASLRAPAAVRAAFHRARADVRLALRCIAHVQRAVLRERPRTGAGSAAKSRKRRAPALPRGMREVKRLRGPRPAPLAGLRSWADWQRRDLRAALSAQEAYGLLLHGPPPAVRRAPYYYRRSAPASLLSGQWW